MVNYIFNLNLRLDRCYKVLYDNDKLKKGVFMKKLSFNEVIEILGVTRTTVYDYIKKGWLVSKKSELNGRVYFDEKQVLELKEAI